jgi:hypothetical protein
MELRNGLQNAPTQIFNSLTQSVTNLSSAYMMLNSVVNIWQQYEKGEVSLGQALAQSFMTLGSVIPAVTSTFSNFKKIGESLSFLEEKETITKLSNTVATEANTVAKEENAAASEEETIEEIVEIATTEKDTTVTALNTKEKIANSMATQELAITSGVLAIAIAALIAAYAYYKTQMEQIIALEEKNQEKLDKAKAWREENKAILEQCDAYDQIKSRYDLQLATREDLNQSILETAEALGIENA